MPPEELVRRNMHTKYNHRALCRANVMYRQAENFDRCIKIQTDGATDSRVTMYPYQSTRTYANCAAGHLNTQLPTTVRLVQPLDLDSLAHSSVPDGLSALQRKKKVRSVKSLQLSGACLSLNTTCVQCYCKAKLGGGSSHTDGIKNTFPNLEPC